MNNKVAEYVKKLEEICSHLDSLTVMEVCGTHTVSLMRSGLRSMLPGNLRLISGPGCPVCVTSQGYIDTACELARNEDVIICTYGDMVRVPGSGGSLAEISAAGGNVEIVYSARDAIKTAKKNPDKKIVFLAIGFETTAPASAASVLEAQALGLDNYLIMPGHKLVLPAMDFLLSAGDVPIDGFMCPGHVSVIIGAAAYRPIVEQYKKPCVVTGFEPEQMAMGIYRIADQVKQKSPACENVYRVAVHDGPNEAAQKIIDQVFEPAPALWRAIGTLDKSGLELKEEYKKFDAVEALNVTMARDRHIPGCICGQVIQGKAAPQDCSLFGKKCTPTKPVGPCMVSSEGTCAAWYKYGK